MGTVAGQRSSDRRSANFGTADAEALVRAAAAEAFGNVGVARLGIRSYRVTGMSVLAVGWLTDTESVNEWLTHLADVAPGRAPVPLAAVAMPGGFVQFVSWMPGTPFASSETTAQDLGRLVADLHGAAISFEPSPGFRRHTVPEEFGPLWLWESSVPDFLSRGASVDDVELLERAWVSQSEVIRQLEELEGERRLVHYDLHGGNLITLADGTVGVVDWEDLAWGYCAMDLAITWFYVPAAHRPMLLEGYASVEAHPAASGGVALEALLVPRWLSLYSWELDAPSRPDKRERYLSRLRSVLE